MDITPHPIDASMSFDDTLFAYLTPLERDVHFVYSDQPLGQPGVPTLSVGYALVVKNRQGKWVLRDKYEEDLVAVKPNLSSVELADLEDKLTAAMNALNGVPGAVNRAKGVSIAILSKPSCHVAHALN